MGLCLHARETRTRSSKFTMKPTLELRQIQTVDTEQPLSERDRERKELFDRPRPSNDYDIETLKQQWGVPDDASIAQLIPQLFAQLKVAQQSDAKAYQTKREEARRILFNVHEDTIGEQITWPENLDELSPHEYIDMLSHLLFELEMRALNEHRFIQKLAS